MNYTTSINLTWEQFASCHSNPTEAFEDLTRQLFNRKYCPGFDLVSTDNNPGIETEPIQIIDSSGNKINIGFQSKYFVNHVKYADIKDSCKKAVTYYSGSLDVIYLYCNKNLNHCQNLDEAEKILSEANIELIVVANNAILDMLREQKYSDLALPYFGALQLSYEWFAKKAEEAFDYLDERFNRLFNVDTEISAKLSLFLRDCDAVTSLNKRKSDLLSEVYKALDRGTLSDNVDNYLVALQKCISSIPDIDNSSIPEALKWDRIIKEDTHVEVEKLNSELTDLEEKMQEVRDKRQNDRLTQKEQESIDREYRQLRGEINCIEELLSLSSRLLFTTEEQSLIQNKVLFIKGDAGTGKSHLLANELHSLIAEKKVGILILGQTLYSPDYVEKQILNALDIDYSFSDFLSVLDNYGVVHEQIIPFMIDAINETWNKGVWKVGLDKIARKIEETRTVKLVVTYRNGYQNILLSDNMKKRVNNGSVVTLSHYGFRGVETEAVDSFLNHYNIPFSPTFYFEYDFSNPLFLSLFCRTYQKGEEQSLPALYERLLQQTNEKVCERLRQKNIEVNDRYNLLEDIVKEFCKECLKKSRRSLTRKEFLSLSVWKNNCLQGKEGICITEFVHEKFFSDIVLDGASDTEDESYYFAYDQMFDYYCAKFIADDYRDDDAGLVDYLTSAVLEINKGRIEGSGEDIFTIVCVLYGKEKGYHIFNAVLEKVSDQYDRYELVHRLLESYSWRKPDSIGDGELKHIVKKYSISCEDLCNLFILNSTKTYHPYNAEYMHSYLMKMPLNLRDYRWTIQINGFVDDNNRLWQLIKLYEKGEKLAFESCEQKKLFLILLAWILTSSNRILRDHTSKAMIEILKDDFQLCEWLLRKFEKVNDPYVIQRLYTISVGACLKRKEDNKSAFNSLAEYIYNTIFNQEYVYPDIILRDSARTLIERFLYEYPEESEEFNADIFRPPYHSQDIPVVKRKEYKDSEKDEQRKCFGIWNITRSLRFEGMGMYGDFGRYVFQSALDCFDIPDSRRHNLNSLLEDQNSFQGNIYYYALQYIFEELGYTNDLFGEYDSSLSQYSYASRSETLKTERIGKKYEWIAMFNILARVSDRYKVKGFDDSLVDYEGAWEPDVRDFDPTYNHKLIVEPSNIPSFEKSNADFNEAFRENYIEFGHLDIQTISDRGKESKKSSEEEILVNDWLFRKVNFFKTTVENLLIDDQDFTQWVVLSRYVDKKAFQQNDFNSNLKQFDTWSWTVPFIAKKEEAENIVSRILQHRRGNVHGISEYDQGTFSGIYNREFPWSPSCKNIREEQWQNLEYHNYSSNRDKSVLDAIIIPELDWNSRELSISDTFKKEKDSLQVPDSSIDKSAEKKALDKEFDDALQTLDEDKLISIIKKYSGNNLDGFTERKTTLIGKVMPAVTSLSVSFQYDATAFDDDGYGYSVTCLSPDITEKLNLSQGTTDGFFYDQKGSLAVIDTDQYGGHAGIVIRKDLLDKYLNESNRCLFWVIYGEKQIFKESHSMQKWSEWEGAFLYKDGKPLGRLQGFKGNQN